MRLSPLTIAGSTLVAALLATAAFLAEPWGQAQTEAGLFRPHDAAKVARGAELYRQHCAVCHGAELEGETPDWHSRDEDGFLPGPPHDETGHTWHHPDQVLFDITKYGLAEAANLPDYKSRMPAFADLLEDGEIIAIFSFIKSRWPDDIRERHDAMNMRHADGQ
jgi:S-disulfanyl-L-cysteine oxidoreductase SoxD